MKQAKCTQCGANIQADETKEAGICPACGAAFVTETAIKNYRKTLSFDTAGGLQRAKTTSDAKTEPSKSCLMVIEDIFAISGRGTVITGEIESGTVSVDESVTIGGRSFTVTGIEHDHKLVRFASAGMSVGLLLRGATKDSFRVGDTVYASNSAAQSASSGTGEETPESIARELLAAGYGARKLDAIKILRDRTGLGLKEAKDVIESVFDGTEGGTSDGTPAPAKQGGCYVATCVYGSYDCPQVWTLRRYRDNVLAATLYGRAFIRTYYAISPTLVRWFGHTAWFKRTWQKRLDRMVSRLQAKGVESTPYEDRDW